MINGNAIKANAQKRLDNLAEFNSHRREWYQNQFLRVADRQSQQIALIFSVAATVLAITTVLPIQAIGFWINLSFLFLLISVMLGIVLNLWLVNFDKMNFIYYLVLIRTYALYNRLGHCNVILASEERARPES